MATIPDSVKARLDTDWTGAGGTEPTYYVEEDIRAKPPTGQDYILILSSTLDTGINTLNDKYVTENHILDIVVNTITSEDRLKEISDEVVRILNATAITDITYQRLKRRQIVSGIEKGIFNYQEVITYDLRQQMKSSAASYGAGPTGDMTIPGDLIVSGSVFNRADSEGLYTGAGDDFRIYHSGSHTYLVNTVGGLIIQNSAVEHIYLDGKNDIQIRDVDDSLAILWEFDTGNRWMKVGNATDPIATTFYDTNDTITVAQISDLLMFGSANAAWVPMVFEHMNAADASLIRGSDLDYSNTGATDFFPHYISTMPTAKGSLKLYVSGFKVEVEDADVSDYLSGAKAYALSRTSGHLTLLNDATNYQSAQTVTYSFAAVDCSSYDAIKLRLEMFVTTGQELDWSSVSMQCYYA